MPPVWKIRRRRCSRRATQVPRRSGSAALPYRLAANQGSTRARAVHLAQGPGCDPSVGTREAERVLVRDVERAVHYESLLRGYASRLDPPRERSASAPAVRRTGVDAPASFE